MTVTDLHPAISRVGACDLVPNLTVTLSRVLSKLSGGPLDDEAVSAISAAASAFIETDGRPQAAAALVSKQIQKVGAREAQMGRQVTDLHAAFTRIHTAVMSELSHIAGPAVVGVEMIELRLRIKKYLHVLGLHAVAGMNEQHRRLDRSRDKRRAIGRLSSPAINGDRSGLVRAVVSVLGELPDEVRLDPALHQRESAYEILLPEGMDLTEFGARLTSQVVYGPLTKWSDLPEALALVWHAASLIRSRSDDRTLVPCEELAGELLVNGNGVLQNMLIFKHLTDLASMSQARRAGLSETLLHWLERGLPVNQLARELGLPPQTLHSRLKTLRDMFGDALDDPTERLELIIALRAVVPLWRRSAS